MKKAITSFVTFTRTERLGLACLLLLIIILLAVRIAIPYFVHPQTDPESEKKLVAAWETYKRSHPPTRPDSATQRKDFQDAVDNISMPLPDTIDVNTADSTTFVRLKGIGPATAHRIIMWRQAKGPFTSIDQLQEAGLTRNTFELLKAHFVARNVSSSPK
jgi:Helix-hairpin-helix motif